MKKHLVLGVLGFTAIMVGYGQSAEASAILNFSTGGSTKLCDTRAAFTATNCGAGFTVNGDTVAFIGTVGAWSIDTLAVTTSNTPGTAAEGKINLGLVDVRHLAGTDDLTVDFGHDNFVAPPGVNPLTSTGAASYDIAVLGDNNQLTGYASNANDMAIPGGTSATALDIVTHVPGCFPAPGTNSSCAMNSGDVPFAFGGATYSLAARAILHQHVSSTDAASYLDKAAVTVPVVPEPATLVLFGSGLIGLAAAARRRRKQ